MLAAPAPPPKENLMLGLSVVKLRDSFESCAGSKVRCSKGRPTWIRCAERATKCQYSIQQGTGRKFRRRDSANDNFKDATSSQTITPSSSTPPLFPDLDTAAGLSMFDSSFGVFDASTSLSTSSDGFEASHITAESLSLPVTPFQNLLSHPDYNQSYTTGNCTLNEANVAFQSFENFLSASGE